MGTKGKKSKKKNVSEQEVEEHNHQKTSSEMLSVDKAKEHKEQLQRLQEKDPEFYEFLKEHDKELLEFNEEDIDEESETEVNDNEMQGDEETCEDVADLAATSEKENKTSKKVITSTMVDSWCQEIQENASLAAVRSLMKAFRTACHYGDGDEDESSRKFSIMSSSVFNKIMLFVLSEMDRILRGLFKLPASGGKKETIVELMGTKQWKNYNHLVKSYFGNALHILNQMTDAKMISFTLKCLKSSSIFLAAFPSFLRRYIKIAVHFWGTGGDALPVVSFLFMRDLCIRVGSGCLDECLKGLYKSYVLNCQFVNATKLQHIQFLGNCVIELLGVDLPAAYQHAFIFIRQLAMVLRETLTMKTKDPKEAKDKRKTKDKAKTKDRKNTKEAFQSVYNWKYINCLELWTGAICAYSSETDLRPLAYPLTQIIYGVSRLVPTARYFPLRLRCVRMLNRLAASTGTFIPLSQLLLDMLEMKELNKPPTGGVGQAVDLRTILKVKKATLKTRAFQEACVFSVVEELAEHLSLWSYSVAFHELSFIPSVRLRNFCKSTKVDRFRREMRQLIREIEANAEFTNQKRASISFLPNDPAAESFLEEEKKSGTSPLSQYVRTLRQRAQQRIESLTESSVIVGANSSTFGSKISENDEDNDSGDENGAAVFSSSWLPETKSKASQPTGEKRKKIKKRQKEEHDETALDEDIVEDLVLSSDENGDEDEDEDDRGDVPSARADVSAKPVSEKHQSKKRKQSDGLPKNKSQFWSKKSKKRRKAD